MLEVTLNPESRWRRRWLTVQVIKVNYVVHIVLRNLFAQDGLLLIFPRPESKFATARVRLPHHGLHGASVIKSANDAN